MLSIFSIPYGNFELDPKINKGLTRWAPFGILTPRTKGYPWGGPKVKNSISHSRFFNNIQKCTHDANFSIIRLEIKDLPLGPPWGYSQRVGVPLGQLKCQILPI